MIISKIITPKSMSRYSIFEMTIIILGSSLRPCSLCYFRINIIVWYFHNRLYILSLHDILCCIFNIFIIHCSLLHEILFHDRKFILFSFFVQYGECFWLSKQDLLLLLFFYSETCVLASIWIDHYVFDVMWIMMVCDDNIIIFMWLWIFINSVLILIIIWLFILCVWVI